MFRREIMSLHERDKAVTGDSIPIYIGLMTCIVVR